MFVIFWNCIILCNTNLYLWFALFDIVNWYLICQNFGWAWLEMKESFVIFSSFSYCQSFIRCKSKESICSVCISGILSYPFSHEVSACELGAAWQHALSLLARAAREPQLQVIRSELPLLSVSLWTIWISELCEIKCLNLYLWIYIVRICFYLFPKFSDDST